MSNLAIFCVGVFTTLLCMTFVAISAREMRQAAELAKEGHRGE